MMWRHKDLLGIRELSREEIELVLDTAEPCREIFAREIKKLPTLRGKTMVNLFYEPSTRTRTSFELAGKWMSADVINITVSASSVAKGESLKDTVRTLESLAADVIVMRHHMAGVPHLVARTVKASVINAGDGMHEHPTQAFLDLFTIRRHKGRIEGLKAVIIGDILHSRVAKSDIWGLVKLGARVVLSGPPTLMPPDIEHMGAEVQYDLDKALQGADVINVLRIQKERQQGGLLPSLREYSALWGMNSTRLKLAREDAMLMHPGPANLGVEITEEVASSPQSVIREQVTNGVAVRMALLYLLSGGGDPREITS